jgi:hypothetical protein
MPDWSWEILENGGSEWEIRLQSPFGLIRVKIGTNPSLPLTPHHSPFSNIQLVRAGELLSGSGEVEPFMGWTAPTYANKIPALSLRVTAAGTPPIAFTTEWILPTDNEPAI